MRRITRTIIAVLSLPLIACSAYAGAELARPFIQVEQQERAAILERLGKYAEMREAYTAFKARVDEQIENITDGDRIIGAKVVSKVGDAIVTDLIFAHDEADGVYENTAAGLRFTGRFAIVRTQESADGNELTLYIGAGQALSYQGHDLTATGNKGIRTVKLDQPLAAFANTESALYTPFGLRTSK